MAGLVMKRRRIANRRRRMTPKQIAIFGTKRQKAALRASRRRHRNAGAESIRKSKKAYKKRVFKEFGVMPGSWATRKPNIGEILTVLPGNPGRRRRKSMAARATNRRRRYRLFNRRHNRRHRVYNRRSNRRHRMYNRRHRRRSAPNVIVRYRNRRHNRRYNRRHNQGIRGALGGDAAKVAAAIGGAILTNIVVGFLPSSFTGGWMGPIATGAVALAAGMAGGKFLGKNIGTWITVGGGIIAGLQILQLLVPNLALPFTLASGGGTSGLGLITGSSFYTPQVNLPGSMASFYLPAAIPSAVPQASSGVAGLGQYRSMRRVGRLR